VAALRAELAAIDPVRACDRQAERAGLAGERDWPRTGLRGRGTRSLNPTSGPRGHASDPVIARLVLRLARGEPEAAHGIPGDDSFDWSARPDHCRLAWLRGRFLAHGSLSIANGRTHLEIVVRADEAALLSRRVAEMGLPAAWRIRRGRGVVTWKSAETVGLLLRRIGAGAALLELEARQVSRSLRGELNRVINAESANVARSVAAAGRQLAAIETLEGEGRLAREPALVRTVAAARRETPEATLTDLSERLAVHRSAVQRALVRIERLAVEGEGQRSPSVMISGDAAGDRGRELEDEHDPGRRR
jgi:hypothetical protein